MKELNHRSIAKIIAKYADRRSVTHSPEFRASVSDTWFTGVYDKATADWEAAAGQQCLMQAIYSFIKMHDTVTIAKIAADLSEYFEMRGEENLHSAPNIILWAYMSQGFKEALEHLLQSNLIFMHPSSPKEYEEDGQQLERLPAIKGTSITEGGREVWMPIVLRVKAARQKSRGGWQLWNTKLRPAETA